MSQVVQQEVLTRLLVEKRIFTKEELLEMVKVVDRRKQLQKAVGGHPFKGTCQEKKIFLQ